MEAKQVIDMALAYRGMKKSTLAEKLGWSPQLLNKRLNTGKFTVDEWKMIGEVLEAKTIFFRFEDGTEI